MYIMKRFKKEEMLPYGSINAAMTDKELLDLFDTNRQKATTVLIEQYSALVYTIIYSKLGKLCPKEDIEETVSDVFIQLCRYADRIDLTKGSINSETWRSDNNASYINLGELIDLDNCIGVEINGTKYMRK